METKQKPMHIQTMDSKVNFKLSGVEEDLDNNKVVKPTLPPPPKQDASNKLLMVLLYLGQQTH